MTGNNPIVAADFKTRTAYICRRNPEFSYHIYVPGNLGTSEQPQKYRVLTLIHGTERSAEIYRNKFVKFAEQNNVIIVAPLFPAGLVDPDEVENYNMLRFHHYAFDKVLLAILEEVAEKFPADIARFDLHGFSAGGQFAHRFFYLYPERLNKVSIGAPGNVTYPDRDTPWPLGFKNISDTFGRDVEIERLRKVQLQLVVGEEDTSPAKAEDGMANRLERSRKLYACYKKSGLKYAWILSREPNITASRCWVRCMIFFGSDCC